MAGYLSNRHGRRNQEVSAAVAERRESFRATVARMTPAQRRKLASAAGISERTLRRAVDGTEPMLSTWLALSVAVGALHKPVPE